MPRAADSWLRRGLLHVPDAHQPPAAPLVTRAVRRLEAQGVGNPVDDVEQRADVDGALDLLVGEARRPQRRGVVRPHLRRPQGQLLQEFEHRPQLLGDGRRAVVRQHRLNQSFTVFAIFTVGHRRDRAVLIPSEDVFIAARGEGGEELPLPDAPRRRPAQDPLDPPAVGPAEDLRPVQEGADDVRQPGPDLPTHDGKEQALDPLPAPHLLQPHRAPPRRTARPRSSRARPAHTAALTATSKTSSSEQPARSRAATSASVIRSAWRAMASTYSRSLSGISPVPAAGPPPSAAARAATACRRDGAVTP